MARFTLPRDLYHGKGALEALKSFTGKKAMICVGGGSMKRFGFLDRAVGYLKEAGMEVELFEGIEPDPSVETVMRGAEAMLKFEPDWIIAMGGGSPIDAAKAMWIKYEYPEITFEEMCKVFGIPPLRRKAHFCAISSTSGTATEVTAFSIITDYQKGIKYPIADFEITPDVAIVDPDLAETMPKKLVAHTGMDALTHAIEGYITPGAWSLSDCLSMQTIRMIAKNLAKSADGDIPAGEQMAYASYITGMAYSNVGLGLVHGMAHPLGGRLGVAHGVANGILLAPVMEYNKDFTGEKYRDIADAFGVEDAYTGDLEKVREEAVQAVHKLTVDLKNPTTISEVGATEADLEPLAHDAFNDVCTPGNPRQATEEDILAIYKSLM